MSDWDALGLPIICFLGAVGIIVTFLWLLTKYI